MNIVQRLKLEMGNREYYDDTKLALFLSENGLAPQVLYRKEIHQIPLLQTVVDIFETIANDTDVMTNVASDMGSTSEIYEWLIDRIEYLKEKIQDLKDAEQTEFNPYDPFTLMISRSIPGPRLIRVNTQQAIE